jgi:hypothetical protein
MLVKGVSDFIGRACHLTYLRLSRRNTPSQTDELL